LSLDSVLDETDLPTAQQIFPAERSKSLGIFKNFRSALSSVFGGEREAVSVCAGAALVLD